MLSAAELFEKYYPKLLKSDPIYPECRMRYIRVQLKLFKYHINSTNIYAMFNYFADVMLEFDAADKAIVFDKLWSYYVVNKNLQYNREQGLEVGSSAAISAAERNTQSYMEDFIVNFSEPALYKFGSHELKQWFESGDVFLYVIIQCLSVFCLNIEDTANIRKLLAIKSNADLLVCSSLTFKIILEYSEYKAISINEENREKYHNEFISDIYQFLKCYSKQLEHTDFGFIEAEYRRIKHLPPPYEIMYSYKYDVKKQNKAVMPFDTESLKILSDQPLKLLQAFIVMATFEMSGVDYSGESADGLAKCGFQVVLDNGQFIFRVCNFVTALGYANWLHAQDIDVCAIVKFYNTTDPYSHGVLIEHESFLEYMSLVYVSIQKEMSHQSLVEIAHSIFESPETLATEWNISSALSLCHTPV